MKIKAKYQSFKEFNKDLYNYKSMDQMYHRLITVLSSVCSDCKNYCFCEKFKKPGDIICPLWYIPLFYNFQEALCQNHTDLFFD